MLSNLNFGVPQKICLNPRISVCVGVENRILLFDVYYIKPQGLQVGVWVVGWRWLFTVLVSFRQQVAVQILVSMAEAEILGTF